MKFWAPLLFFLVVGVSCAGPAPYEDYTYANAAREAARKAGAEKHAPGLWFQSDEAYRKAERAFYDRYYKQARKHFISARKYAEKAENSTKLKKFESGEGF